MTHDIQGNTDKNDNGLLLEIIKTRDGRDTSFQCWKKNKTTNIDFFFIQQEYQKWKQNKDIFIVFIFPVTEYITSTLALEEILKEVFRLKKNWYKIKIVSTQRKKEP